MCFFFSPPTLRKSGSIFFVPQQHDICQGIVCQTSTLCYFFSYKHARELHIILLKKKVIMQGLGLARPILTPFVTNSVMVISHLLDLLDSSQTEKISDLDQVWFYAQVLKLHSWSASNFDRKV